MHESRHGLCSPSEHFEDDGARDGDVCNCNCTTCHRCVAPDSQRIGNASNQVTRRHRARHCEFPRTPLGKKLGRQRQHPRSIVKSAAQSGTCGGVVLLTLVYSTLTVEALSVVNEGILDKERFSAGDTFALSNGLRFGRPSRRRSDLALAVHARYCLTVHDLAMEMFSVGKSQCTSLDGTCDLR